MVGLTSTDVQTKLSVPFCNGILLFGAPLRVDVRKNQTADGKP